MTTDKKIIMFQKAAVYDLLQLIGNDPGKTYTVEELRELMEEYINGQEQF